jgi:toxin ParE1/3/4
MRVRFSLRARQDYEDILIYTKDEWGEEQARRYAQDFEHAFERLSQFPSLGKPAPVLGRGVRAIRVNQHIVVYESVGDELLIIRVAHIRSRPLSDLDL